MESTFQQPTPPRAGGAGAGAEAGARRGGGGENGQTPHAIFFTCPLANHRLDGERVPGLHDAVRLVVPVVQNVGVGVKHLPDAVSTCGRGRAWGDGNNAGGSKP